MILIATGSRPFHPPGIPFDDPDVLDSETARELDRPMESLVVVGRGGMACEYASIFMALGADVTLVDRGERLMPFLEHSVRPRWRSASDRSGCRCSRGRG